jgi:PadR family transcriptional regulator, regulatory protein PadR
MDNKIRQLRKGVLELALLGCLYHESHYGYSLIRSLSLDSDLDLTEGTIYPILSRLAREGLVRSDWAESHQGPPRKYYSLTETGRKTFEVLVLEFQKLAAIIGRVNPGTPPSTPEDNPSPSHRPLSVEQERTP